MNSETNTKEMIENRIAWLEKEVAFRKGQLKDPFLHHHYMGFLEAADGTCGELQFLRKLLDSEK